MYFTMKKEVAQHIIYGFIIALVVTSIVLYQNKVTVETRQMLSTEISDLSEKLEQTQSQLEIAIAQLTDKNVALQSNITKLDTSLKEKETEINSLTGDLNQLREDNKQQVAVLEDTINNLKTQNQDFSDVIDDVIPAVVSIKTNVGLGSGFFVRDNGYVVTNYHVIDGATAASIFTLDGAGHAVRLVGFDQNADIAVLKTEGSFSYLNFGNSATVRVGEKVIAVGNPGGLDFTVTQGIISATRQSNGNTYLQIDVPINPGNSGGPLVNTAGKVIGVNSLKISGFEGVGFAIVSNQVKDIVDQIITADG